MTMQVVVAEVQVLGVPPEDVTVYPVIAAPPLETGAVHATEAELFPPMAMTVVGAPGTVDGVAAAEAGDGGLVRGTALVAVTVNVYATPLVRPVTVHVVAGVAGDTDVVVQVLAGAPEDVTVYLVTVDPPLDAGAVQDTTDWVLANEVAATLVGVLGATGAGVTEFDAVEAVLLPEPLVATTVNV